MCTRYCVPLSTFRMYLVVFAFLIMTTASLPSNPTTSYCISQDWIAFRVLTSTVGGLREKGTEFRWHNAISEHFNYHYYYDYKQLCSLCSLQLLPITSTHESGTDSSQCRNLASCHPLSVVHISTTHDSSLSNGFASSQSSLHCASPAWLTLIHQQPCAIAFLAKSIIVRSRSSTKAVCITSLWHPPNTPLPLQMLHVISLVPPLKHPASFTQACTH